MVKRVFFIIFCLFLVLPLFFIARADELDDITKQLDSLKKDLQDKEVNYQNLNKQLDDIRARVSDVELQIVQKEKEVKVGEAALSYQRELLNERARSYYKNINKNAISIINLLTSENLSTSLNNFFYQKTVVDQDRNAIAKIVRYIKDIETKKAELQSEKIKLAVINEEIDAQTKILAGEITQTKQKIAQLSDQQQSLVAQKQAGLNIPRSAATSLSGCVDDRGKDPGFNPKFAFFTYGVPNRTGLNQYGAKGRAEAGQGVEQILQAYYTNYELKKDYSTDININVDGHGSFNIEEYVKRIYEMPESWHIEALKAQVIAARSYALSYTNNGQGSICTSQSCQVFKPDPKGGAWDQAVNDTKGWVMVQGGAPIKAWYSSTHGGYVLATSELPGWSETSWTKHATDTSSGSAGNFSDLQNNAYDKSSPWFYCDWGSRSQYNNTAWLKSSEVADIANAILLARSDSSTGEHLYQTDKPHPYGGEVWNEDRVKQELKNKGITPYSSVSGISIGADFGSGKTNSINISGDHGSESFSGDEFKGWLNLRAPANIQIVGPLYNVETQ
ncbi:MAG: SpoIID/LytB domain-containing protein [bacterium]